MAKKNEGRKRTAGIGIDAKMGAFQIQRDISFSYESPGRKNADTGHRVSVSTSGENRIGPLRINGSGETGVRWGGGPREKKFAQIKVPLKLDDNQRSPKKTSTKSKGATMSRSQAASVAAKARWAGRSKKK